MRITVGAGPRSLVVAAGLILGALVAPAVAKAPELAMLDGLTDGSWELRYREDDARSRICVHSGRELIQIRHSAAKCSPYVVDDEPNLVTVQYTCPGHGYGRTTVRRETPQLVQIEAQGIEDGLPFHFTAEGRRVGGC
jgi:hypothetical protein